MKLEKDFAVDGGNNLELHVKKPEPKSRLGVVCVRDGSQGNREHQHSANDKYSFYCHVAANSPLPSDVHNVYYIQYDENERDI